jgi:tyrosyl-tRNA synthetase
VKVKKPKDKGDPAKRAAAAAARKGASGVVAQPDGPVEGPEKEKVTLDADGTVADTLKKLHVDGES